MSSKERVRALKMLIETAGTVKGLTEELKRRDMQVYVAFRKKYEVLSNEQQHTEY